MDNNDNRRTTQTFITRSQLASFQQDASFSDAGTMVLMERRAALVTIASLVFGACAPKAIGGENPMSNPATIGNKASYLAAKAAYNARDLDKCLAYYAPDHQIMSKPTPPGREHIRAFFEDTFATWPDIQIVVENVLAEDEWVMGRSTSSATHSETVMGVLPTGKKIVAGFWDLHRFDEDGLIAQTWNLIDSLSIMQQLGVVPCP